MAWFSATVSVCLSVGLSPPKSLDQSKNVTVRTFHIWPGSVHEHRGPWRHVAEPDQAGRSVATSIILFLFRFCKLDDHFIAEKLKTNTPETRQLECVFP